MGEQEGDDGNLRTEYGRKLPFLKFNTVPLTYHGRTSIHSGKHNKGWIAVNRKWLSPSVIHGQVFISFLKFLHLPPKMLQLKMSENAVGDESKSEGQLEPN